MPYTSEWTPNELVVEHNGVKIFHTYRDNEESHGTSGAYFCWSADNDEFGDSEGEHTFDVRKLPLYASIVIAQRPPYIWIHKGKPEPEYERDTPALRARWKKFHKHEITLLKEVLRKSLDNGDLKAPPGLTAAQKAES